MKKNKQNVAFSIILTHNYRTLHFQFSTFYFHLRIYVSMHLFILQDLKFNINKILPGAPSFSLHSLFLCCHFVSGLLCEKTMVIPGESQTKSVIGWLSRPLPEFWEVIGGSEECWEVFLTQPGILGGRQGSISCPQNGAKETQTGNRKQKEETAPIVPALSPWKPPKRGERGSRDFSYPSNP